MRSGAEADTEAANRRRSRNQNRRESFPLVDVNVNVASGLVECVIVDWYEVEVELELEVPKRVRQSSGEHRIRTGAERRELGDSLFM